MKLRLRNIEAVWLDFREWYFWPFSVWDKDCRYKRLLRVLFFRVRYH